MRKRGIVVQGLGRYSWSDQVASHPGLKATNTAHSMPVTMPSPQAMSQRATSDNCSPTPGSTWPAHCDSEPATNTHSAVPRKPRPST